MIFLTRLPKLKQFYCSAYVKTCNTLRCRCIDYHCLSAILRYLNLLVKNVRRSLPNRLQNASSLIVVMVFYHYHYSSIYVSNVYIDTFQC